VLNSGHGLFVFFDNRGGRVHQPDFAGAAGVFPGEEGDGLVHGLFLGAKVEDVAVGLGVVEHTVGAREGLNQAVVLEVLVHVQGVEVLGVEPGEQHVHHDAEVDLVLAGVVAVGVLLILDSLLYVLIVEVELAKLVVGAVLGVVVGNDLLQSGLFLFRLLLVIGLLLGQVFLQLLYILVAVRRRREDTGDMERNEVRIFGLALGLHLLEQAVVADGVVDGGRGQHRVEAAVVGCGIVLGQNRVHHGPLGQHLAGFRAVLLGLATGCLVGLALLVSFRLALWFEIVDMKAQHVAVIDGVGDGVGV